MAPNTTLVGLGTICIFACIKRRIGDLSDTTVGKDPSSMDPNKNRISTYRDFLFILELLIPPSILFGWDIVR